MPTLAPPKEQSAPPMTRLVKEAKQREDYINKIKKLVAQPVDNINHPVPLFTQLEQSN